VQDPVSQTRFQSSATARPETARGLWLCLSQLASEAQDAGFAECAGLLRVAALSLQDSQKQTADRG
jgi:hypothetical protein